MTSVDSNFNFLCGRPHGAGPPPPRPPEPDPLRVDVINGWPLSSRRFLTGGFCLEGFVQGGFCLSTFCQNTFITTDFKLNITFKFRFHMYDFFKSVLLTPLCAKYACGRPSSFLYPVPPRV